MQDTTQFKPLPPTVIDPILGLQQYYNKDQNQKKVNLTIGLYKDENGKSWILPSVWQAMRQIQTDFKTDYLKPQGDLELTKEAVKLAYGEENGIYGGNYKLSQIAQAQSVSGTGALFLMMNVISKFYLPLQKNRKVYLPNPSWANHANMLKSQNIEPCYYRYYDMKQRVFTYDLMIQDLQQIPEESVVLFHAVGHNPTGFDPSHQQWNEILQICKQRKFMNVFDMAYQGFVSGDVEKDAYAVRLFSRNKMPIMVCQSFAKNFGLYGHRVGCFSMPCMDEQWVKQLNNFFNSFIRKVYSNNPRFGSDIVKTILQNPNIKKQWEQDIKTMSGRISNMRNLFSNALKREGVLGWDFIQQQQGMFAFTPITKQQAIRLREEFSVYMLENGRMSLSGFNEKNVDYVAKAIKVVTTSQQLCQQNIYFFKLKINFQIQQQYGTYCCFKNQGQEFVIQTSQKIYLKLRNFRTSQQKLRSFQINFITCQYCLQISYLIENVIKLTFSCLKTFKSYQSL